MSANPEIGSRGPRRGRLAACRGRAIAGIVVAALIGWPASGAGNAFIEPWANSYVRGVGFQSGSGSESYSLSNVGATLQTGEPTEGGLLTRSIWGRLTPAADTRVVIHTFGSEVDTVLAVFTAAPNVPRTFAVFVQRPAVDPGFDPGQRRIFVKFEELSPPNFLGSNPIPILAGSTSVAPRAE